MKAKILWGIAAFLAVVFLAVSIITYAAITDKPKVVSAIKDPARWVQTNKVHFDNTKPEEYFYTCGSNGRQEGTVYQLSDGLWQATSEHETDHWNGINDKFRTKTQAEQAIEGFVAKYDMCAGDK